MKSKSDLMLIDAGIIRMNFPKIHAQLFLEQRLASHHRRLKAPVMLYFRYPNWQIYVRTGF